MNHCKHMSARLEYVICVVDPENYRNCPIDVSKLSGTTVYLCVPKELGEFRIVCNGRKYRTWSENSRLDIYEARRKDRNFEMFCRTMTLCDDGNNCNFNGCAELQLSFFRQPLYSSSFCVKHCYITEEPLRFSTLSTKESDS